MIFSINNRSEVSLGRKQIFFFLLWTIVFLLALYFRTSGLFRGLGAQGNIFHPDESKQILALFNFLNGDYVRYYGSLFYDGYPYGLNHLDEYLLRPILFFLGFDSPDQKNYLFYLSRLLRVVYGMTTVVLIYPLTLWLVRDRTAAVLGMFLLAISPLSVTVTHFATGDVGVDLFTALCFICLVFFVKNCQKRIWLFLVGIAVGSAYSAKYNGLLVGMVPALVLLFQYLHHKNLRILLTNLLLLFFGTITGILILTPSLFLDFENTVKYTLANFAFLKNYNVPPEIIALPPFERALQSLKHGIPYIVKSLGNFVCLASIPVLAIGWQKYLKNDIGQENHEKDKRLVFLLTITLFPIVNILIALSGKYTVQPFHFSSLHIPLIMTSCFLFSYLYTSQKTVLRWIGILFAIFMIWDFGKITWKENFFWRLEDNSFYEQNLPVSLYQKESFYTHQSGKIRSLYLEPTGVSIFRNRKDEVQGPDSNLWNTLGVAPLPQVPEPLGQDWIFLNGPTFPRNERALFIHGEGHGKTVKRYLVLPAGNNWPLLGIRSGSYATKVSIDMGSATTNIQLEAHQQKTVFLQPKKWKVSGGDTPGEEKVFICPITFSVPHDDVWITFIISDKEKNLFNLFGGGQDEVPVPPEKTLLALEQKFHDALTRIRYKDMSLSQRLWKGQKIPLWEIPLPAGRYILTVDIEGLDEKSEVAVQLEDAKGGTLKTKVQSFPVKKGLQQINYSFTKPFAPYQSKFIIHVLQGDCQIRALRLVPDHLGIANDFDIWRNRGVKPAWISRFEQ